jgi:hypothetical protein
MKIKRTDGRIYEVKYLVSVNYRNSDMMNLNISNTCNSQIEGYVFLKNTLNALNSMNYELIDAKIERKNILSKDRLEKRNESK